MDEHRTSDLGGGIPSAMESGNSGTLGLSDTMLRRQNRAFADTAGVSEGNRSAGFVPAFKNMSTNRTVISRFADGKPAPLHLLDGLPDAWVQSRDSAGNVVNLVAAVVAGFVHDGRFYTREAAAMASVATRGEHGRADAR